MRRDCDVAVIGSGFGGSLLAMIARRLGHRVMLLERGRHPRFAIGESASPLAGLVLEQLAIRYELPRLLPLATFGAWQRTYPHVICGLKRGFTYFKHQENEPYRAAADRSNQLLVAASPNDEVSDTHWLRSDVDHFLVREAISLGVEYLDNMELDGLEAGAGGTRLRGRRLGVPSHLSAGIVVDASGPGGFSSRVLGVRNRGFDAYPATQALFSHFTGVARCADLPEYECAEIPPYAPDDAALHHVFDGGWIWVLRFGNGVTSAGAAVTDALAADLRLADGPPAWERLLARYPSIAAQFANARPIREFTWMRRLARCAEAAAGPGWAMLPSAAAFVDPLFSTGIPLTLLGIERLARILESGPDACAQGSALGEGALDAYSDITLGEAAHTARYIAGCYAGFPQFEAFTAYSMFYFAAASFSEMARRLGVQPASARFLRADHPPFAEATVRLSPEARGPHGERYADVVAQAIAPLNVAGLCDAAKRNWYGVDWNDAWHGAHKLGVPPGRVAELAALFR